MNLQCGLNLLTQVEELKVATNCCSDSGVVPHDASNMDRELEETAHKEQYIFKKKDTSVFKVVREKPSSLVELGEG